MCCGNEYVEEPLLKHNYFFNHFLANNIDVNENFAIGKKTSSNGESQFITC